MAKLAFSDAHGRRLKAAIVRWVIYGATLLTVAVLFGILGYILCNGVPNLTPELFAWEYTTDNVSLMPAFINTILIAALALTIAVPLGIGAAIYLVEYARRGNRFVMVVRAAAETLQGIPSIIYGLFGLLFFVTALGWRLSLMAGAFTLAIMVLPVIMRTTEEALLAVPNAYREASFGLGAGRLRTVFCCVLPTAIPGIVGGVILALGRCVGEVAALLYTAGSVAEVPNFLQQGFAAFFQPTRTLATHLYVLASEGLHTQETFATAVVLLILVITLNLGANFFAKKLGVKREDG